MPTYGGGFAVIDLDIYLIGGLNQENTDTNTLQVFNTGLLLLINFTTGGLILNSY